MDFMGSNKASMTRLEKAEAAAMGGTPKPKPKADPKPKPKAGAHLTAPRIR